VSHVHSRPSNILLELETPLNESSYLYGFHSILSKICD
jgi:hypothetical protein